MNYFGYTIKISKEIGNYYDISILYRNKEIELIKMLTFGELIIQISQLRAAGMAEYHNRKVTPFPIPVINY